MTTFAGHGGDGIGACPSFNERRMIIQINTDRNIGGDSEMTARVETAVRHAVQYVADHITRIEVHLSDENGAAKSGPDDKHCRLEARLAGRPPILVSHQAPTVEQSVGGAAGKLKRSLDHIFGKLSAH